MLRRILSLTSLVVICQTSLHAQDYGAMIQQQMQQGANMAAQMQQMQQGIVQQNMQNPQVQQMYQQHLAQGGTMSFEQFAYGYAATGGYSQQGKQQYYQNEQMIQRNEQAAIGRYRDSQAENYQAMQDMHQRNSEIAHHRGNTLNGTTDYRDPSNGNTYNLPHNMPPNSYQYDYNSGQVFRNDQQGNYQRGGNDGYWYDLEEDD